MPNTSVLVLTQKYKCIEVLVENADRDAYAFMLSYTYANYANE